MEFRNRRRQPGEGINDFLASLRSLALKAYGNIYSKSQLEDRCLEMFIDGQGGQLREELRKRPFGTLSEALVYCRHLEAAGITMDQPAIVGATAAATTTFNHASIRSNDRRTNPEPRRCFHCGSQNHLIKDCPDKKKYQGNPKRGSPKRRGGDRGGPRRGPPRGPKNGQPPQPPPTNGGGSNTASSA